MSGVCFAISENFKAVDPGEINNRTREEATGPGPPCPAEGQPPKPTGRSPGTSSVTPDSAV